MEMTSLHQEKRSNILKFQKQLAGRFTIKSKIVGSGGHLSIGSNAALGGVVDSVVGGGPGGELKEARILNRIVRWTQHG